MSAQLPAPAGGRTPSPVAPVPGPAPAPTRAARAGAAATPTVTVTVRRTGPGASPEARWSLDSRTLDPAGAQELSGLVDAVEAAGPPAGGTAALGAWRDTAGYEITVARGYGHWIARIGDGHLSGPLERLVRRVLPGDTP